METSRLLGLLVPVITILFSCAFFVFWLNVRERRSLLAVSAALAVMAIGFICSNLLLQPDSIWVIPIRLICLTAGVSLAVIAMRLRLGLSAPVKTLGGACLAGFVVFSLATLQGAGIAALTIIPNIALSTVCLIGFGLLKGADKPSALDRLMRTLTGVTGVQFLLAALAPVFVDMSVSSDPYNTSFYLIGLHISLICSIFAFAVALFSAEVFDVARQRLTEAETDGLTGLTTYKVFNRQARALLNETIAPTGIILFDLDHLKIINRTYGHEMGDSILAEIGRLVLATIKKDMMVSRIAGKRFCIIMPYADITVARLFAEHLRQAVSLLDIKGLEGGHRLSASFGVAINMPGTPFHTTYTEASDALQRAKKNGRDQVALSFRKAG